jgi:ech hydrogenase subunit F
MSLFRMSRTISRNLVQGPVTRMYPRVSREPYENTRGKIAIEIQKCIFCGLCQRRCPPKAITVTKEQKTWAIKRHYCITCDACVEECPVHCLSTARQYSRAAVERHEDCYRQQENTAPKDTQGEADSPA